MFFYHLIRTLSFVVRPFYPVKFINKENVPKNGAALFVVNHSIWYDPVALAYSTRRHIRYIAKSEIFKNPIFGFLLRKAGIFPVHRGNDDISAIRTSLSILKNGGLLCIFPEGTRGKYKQELQTFHDGAAMIALMSKAPCIPVYMQQFRLFRRTKVHFGKPVDFGQLLQKKVGSYEMKQATQIIVDCYHHLMQEAKNTTA